MAELTHTVSIRADTGPLMEVINDLQAQITSEYAEEALDFIEGRRDVVRIETKHVDNPDEFIAVMHPSDELLDFRRRLNA